MYFLHLFSLVFSNMLLFSCPVVSPDLIEIHAATFQLNNGATTAQSDCMVAILSFHGLLVAWVMEGVRERVSTHAVPTFWRQHSCRLLPAADDGAHRKSSSSA